MTFDPLKRNRNVENVNKMIDVTLDQTSRTLSFVLFYSSLIERKLEVKVKVNVLV